MITLAGIPLLFKLPFDSNPMHLRSPKVESISTYLDLIKDPETSPNIIDVHGAVRRRRAERWPKAACKLPSVAKVIDINTFVPPDQDQKLATIAETAQLLGPVLNPGRKPPPPTDADNVKAIKEAVDRAASGIANQLQRPRREGGRRPCRTTSTSSPSAPVGTARGRQRRADHRPEDAADAPVAGC